MCPTSLVLLDPNPAPKGPRAMDFLPKTSPDSCRSGRCLLCRRPAFGWRSLVAVFALVLCASPAMAPALYAGDYPAPLIAPSANTNNTDFGSVEFQQAAPMIAPEPISPGPVKRSVYEDAVLGPEAPAIVLTSGVAAPSSPGAGEPIAPTADGD